mgnify:CR=1 FL=1
MIMDRNKKNRKYYGRRSVCLGLAVLTAFMLTGCVKEETEVPPEKIEEQVTQAPKDMSINQVIDLTEYLTLGQYKGIEVQKAYSGKVSKKEVEQIIQNTLMKSAEQTEKKNGRVEEGDYVVISFQGYRGIEVVAGAKCENMTVQIGSGVLLKDMEQKLIGANSGEEVIMDVCIPNDDVSDYAGETLKYHVIVSEIYQMDVPKLNKKTAKQYFSCDSVQAVRQSVRENLKKEKEQEAQESMQEEAWAKAVSNAKISSYPQEQLEECRKQFSSEYEAAAQEEKLSVTDYMEQHYGLSEEQYKEQLEKAAKDMLASEMVYQAIIKEEKLSLTDEEYEDGLKRYIDGEQYTSREELLERVGEERVRQRILYRKAYYFVYEHAEVVSD